MPTPTTFHWSQAVSGTWNTTVDWNPNGTPGSTNPVFIDATGSPYTVSSTTTNETGALTIVGVATLLIDSGTEFVANGAISNAGTISIDGQSTANTYFIINGPVTLSGGGIVAMSDNAQNMLIGNGGASAFTNVDNTIEGSGQIGGGFSIDNQALIDATGANNALVIDNPGSTINTGTLEAQGAAGLLIENTDVNDVGGTIEASGGDVTLASSTITGGTLESVNSGLIEVVSRTTTLEGTRGNTIDNTGNLAVENDAALALQGAIDNTSSITLANTNSANQTFLLINAAGVTLTGGGTVSLTDNAGNTIQGAGGSDTLTNVDNTIEGSGQIGGDFSIDNQALIDATGTNNALVIDNPGSTINTGTLEGQGAAGLLIENTDVNDVGGTVEANGGDVSLETSTITGGTLETANGGLIKVVSRTTTLDGTGGSTIDNTGNLAVENDAALALQGAIDNTGSITLANTNSANQTFLLINAAGVTLSGGGTVSLADNAGNAIQSGGGSDTLTNVDNTIQGAGQINLSGNLANEQHGIVNATGLNSLTIDAAGVTNQGLLEATGAGGLVVLDSAVSNAGGILAANGGNVDLENASVTSGTIDADGGNVELETATITGATLEMEGGGAIEALNRSNSFVGTTASAIANTGLVAISSGDALSLQGPIDNTGTITLENAGTANQTLLLITSAGATLSGGGTVSMSDNTGNIIEGAGGTDTLTNVDNTIEGAGQIGAGAELINEGQGTVNASDNNNLVTRQPMESPIRGSSRRPAVAAF